LQVCLNTIFDDIFNIKLKINLQKDKIDILNQMKLLELKTH